MMEAQNLVYAQLGYKADAVIALEIGGGNGLQGQSVGFLTLALRRVASVWRL